MFACLFAIACTGSVEDAHRNGGTAGTANIVPLVDSSVRLPDTSTDTAISTPDAGTDADVADLDAAMDAAIDEVDAYVPPPPPPPVVFEPAPGTWSGSMTSLTLVPRTPDTELFYTLDDTYPTDKSTPYTVPIALTTTTTVRVAAYEDGVLVSLRSGTFIQLGTDLTTFSSNLPLVIVHMRDADLPKEADFFRVPAVAQFYEPSGAGRATLVGAPTTDARIGIKIRGRSTRGQPKHNYTIELHDQVDADYDEPLLGMPADSDWALYAPYEWDRSFIRNAFWYTLSRSIGRYAPRTRFCEVFLAANGETVDMDKYQGVYVLVETIKRGDERVDIEKLDTDDTMPPELSGGYIVKVDQPDTGDIEISIEGVPAMGVISYPDDADRTTEQTTYITDYMNAVGRSIAAVDHVDPTTGMGRDALMDIDAFIDHHILNTIAMNPDAFRLSAPMHKDRGGKMMAGPLWDCDRCMGSYDDRDDDPQEWWGNGGTDLFGFGWYGGLFDDPAFEQLYWDRFEELLAGPLAYDTMVDTIEELAEQLEEAAPRNYAKWVFVPPRGNMYRNEIDDLEAWLDQRVTWVTDNIGMR